MYRCWHIHLSDLVPKWLLATDLGTNPLKFQIDAKTDRRLRVAGFGPFGLKYGPNIRIESEWTNWDQGLPARGPGRRGVGGR